MDERLRRLLQPRSVALIGGAWADAVAAASRRLGFAGELWHIHPTREQQGAQRYYRGVEDLPGPPDAAFIAAPRSAAVAAAGALRARAAGGFVCFASGFSETASPEGTALAAELALQAAGLPYLGPNCYGFINFFDRVALWPDQVVGEPLPRGVALICQSGTIALTLMFNARSLPIGYLFTVGNQDCLAIEDLIEALAGEDRVSAFGIYVEGIKDAARLARAVGLARAAGKPIALIKSGRSEVAARTTRTHTGALAGTDAVFDAFCRQEGIARCDTLATLIETLKLMHCGGPLPGRRVMILGASGGDMAMSADLAEPLGLTFPPVTAATAATLQKIAGDRVTVANPFDFHTYIWFDPPAMRALFTAVLRAGYDAVGFVLDNPPEGRADTAAFMAAIDEFIAAAASACAVGGNPCGVSTRAALIASLPETLALAVGGRCLEAGVVPLQGLREALEALDLAGRVGERWRQGPALELLRPAPLEPGSARRGGARTLTEPEAKLALRAAGIAVPASRVAAAAQVADAAESVGFPVVIKAVGAELAHKSDVGGVVLNVQNVDEARAAAARLAALFDTQFVESMITDGVLEVLVGVIKDPQFGLTLVLGSGGVLTELLRDSVSLLPPFTGEAVRAALSNLRCAPLMQGFRGRPVADVAALIELVLAVTRFAAAHVDTLLELELNPVIVRPLGRGAIAVDALIRLQH